MNDKVREILERRERRRILAELQAAAEERGEIPAMPRLLTRRMAGPLRYAGGALVAFASALLALLGNFFLLVRLLHLWS